MPAVETVTLVVTRRCGAACPGCPVVTGVRDMPSAVLDGAVRLLPSLPGVGRVKFFGGEPLLNFGLVLRGIASLRSPSFPLRFEIGTNGLLLDPKKVSCLRRYPNVQVNINGGVSVRKGFLKLPNMIWNLCVQPECPALAVRLLRRISGLPGAENTRVNLLPAYYRAWTPEQLNGLRSAAREMAAIVRDNGMLFEKEKRGGAVPLFSDGVTVDVDGRCYSTNFCLARLPAGLRRRFLLGNVKFPEKLRREAPALRKKDLVEAFGVDAVASTYAADRIMGEYV